MATTPVWIAAYGGPYPGATPMYRSSDPNATSIQVVGYGAPPSGGVPSGVTPIWICTPSASGAVAASVAAVGGAWSSGAPAAPVNTVAPAASGTLTVGSTLSTTNGTWTGSPTPTYTYQWQRGGVNISGATSATYLTVTADGGTSVACVVTATNASGNASATSNALAIAAATSTWSAADASAVSPALTLSNSNMTVASTSSGAWQTIRNTTSHASGKWYFECLMAATPSSFYMWMGVANAAFTVANGNYLGSGVGSSCGMRTGATSATNDDAIKYQCPSFTLANNDVLAIALDMDGGNIWIAQNNVWMNSSNPATGSLPIVTFTPSGPGALFAAFTLYSSATGSATLQPTAASQKYAPPSGFTAWG